MSRYLARRIEQTEDVRVRHRTEARRLEALLDGYRRKLAAADLDKGQTTDNQLAQLEEWCEHKGRETTEVCRDDESGRRGRVGGVIGDRRGRRDGRRRGDDRSVAAPVRITQPRRDLDGIPRRHPAR